MKKLVICIFLMGASILSFSQSTRMHSSFGVVTILDKDYNTPFSPVSYVGLDINDKISLEYGYTWTLNNSENDLYNFISGNLSSYTAGNFAHLISATYIAKSDELLNMRFGLGVLLNKVYKTSGIENQSKLFFRGGYDVQLSKTIGVILNVNIGEVMGASAGLSVKF
jgi:hypothetical protein